MAATPGNASLFAEHDLPTVFSPNLAFSDDVSAVHTHENTPLYWQKKSVKNACVSVLSDEYDSVPKHGTSTLYLTFTDPCKSPSGCSCLCNQMT